jgi:hypothetical protein
LVCKIFGAEWETEREEWRLSKVTSRTTGVGEGKESWDSGQSTGPSVVVVKRRWRLDGWSERNVGLELGNEKGKRGGDGSGRQPFKPKRFENESLRLWRADGWEWIEQASLNSH